MAKVIAVKQSPLNKLQWCCDLHCGHEVWVTANRRPRAQNMYCPKCADIVERLQRFAKDGVGGAVLIDAAEEIKKLRERVRDLESAKVSIDVDCLTNGDGHRVFGRVVDWQPEDYEAGGSGKGIGVRLLCEYESDNFGMRK